MYSFIRYTFLMNIWITGNIRTGEVVEKGEIASSLQCQQKQ